MWCPPAVRAPRWIWSRGRDFRSLRETGGTLRVGEPWSLLYASQAVGTERQSCSTTCEERERAHRARDSKSRQFRAERAHRARDSKSKNSQAWIARYRASHACEFLHKLTPPLWLHQPA